MNNRKSNFQKPSPQNAFKKSDRKYPQPKILTQNVRQMIPQVDQVRSIIKRAPVITSNVRNARYHFIAQKSFPIYQNGNDNTPIINQQCLWYRRLPNNITTSSNNNERSLKIYKTDFTIGGWIGAQFPSVIYISIKGFEGFADIYGATSPRVAALQLASITACNDSADIKSYDLYYVSRQIQWKIPSSMTSIQLFVIYDDSPQPVILPLPNPICIDIEIIFK